MEKCTLCGKEAESMPFTIWYNDSTQEWELGSTVCRNCATADPNEDEIEDEESARFHAWADSQR